MSDKLGMSLSRRALLAGAAAATTIGLPALAEAGAGPVRGAITPWQRGFDLALDHVAGAGGIAGRPIGYVFEDGVAGPRIIIRLGDIATSARPIYQGPAPAERQAALADHAIRTLGLCRPAVLHNDTAWCRAATDAFATAAAAHGAPIVAVGDLARPRSALERAQAAKPDGLVLLASYADAALLVRQIRDIGLTLVAASANRALADGRYVMSTVYPAARRPAAQLFVADCCTRHDLEPDSRYDTLVQVTKLGRPAMHDGPGAIFGRVQLDPATQQPQLATYSCMLS